LKVLIAAVYGETVTCRLVGGNPPVVGQEYHLEDARTKTQAQNKTFHMLIRMYFASGCFSDDAHDEKELKEFIMYRLGEGAEKYIYWDGNALVEVKDKQEIPAYILSSPNKKSLVKAKLKRWSMYTLREGRTLIKALIAEMITTGVSGKEFEEILKEFYDG